MRKLSQYYRREQRKGRTLSIFLHLFFILLAIFGLPEFMSSPPPEEPIAISVELLPITGITNIKPMPTPPAPEKKPEEKTAEQKKPSPPVKTADSTPPPPPEPKDAVKKPEEKKPEEKKPEDKKPTKAKPEDLEAVLKAVKATAQKEKTDNKKTAKDNAAPNKAISTQYNPELPMSMSEKDAVMSQIAKCWNVPAGAKDAQNLVVVINAEYGLDGTYTKVEIASESRTRYNTDSFFRAAAESAIRAIKQCSPLKGLPPEKYQTWRSMELRFDPKFMLN